MAAPHDPGPQVLLADVNGYQATIARVGKGSRPGRVETVDCTSQDQLIDLLAAAQNARDGSILGAAIAAPGPNLNGVLKLTHSTMRLEAEVIAQRLGLDCLHLVNNFTARALAVPLLEAAAVEQVGGGSPHRDAPAGAIGPSDGGVGMSILNPDGFVGWVAAAAEGGHVELAAANDREADVIRILRGVHGYVSAEQVLSGQGVLDVALALSTLAGTPARPANLDALLEAAGQGDAVARETFDLVSGWLGAVSGNLVLTAGARGGIYIISATVQSFGEQLDRAIMRERFEAKGRMSAYLRDVPLYLVTDPHCGLLGLTTLFR